MRIAILSHLFSASWDQHDIVGHDCIGPECCRDREKCLLTMHTLGVASLCATSPPTFPRSRWTGFVPALCWPLLLEMIHGLLSVTYKVLASQQRGGENVCQEDFIASVSEVHASAGEGHVPMIVDDPPLGHSAAAGQRQAEAGAHMANDPAYLPLSQLLPLLHPFGKRGNESRVGIAMSL